MIYFIVIVLLCLHPPHSSSQEPPCANPLDCLPHPNDTIGLPYPNDTIGLPYPYDTTGQQNVFDNKTDPGTMVSTESRRCISTYQELKGSLRSNLTNNVQKLLDIFYPPNMAPTHVVFVRYCVKNNLTDQFELTSNELDEEYCNSTFAEMEFQWLTNTIPLLIDSDVFMANTFNFANLVTMNLSLTLDPFCEGINGLSLLETLTVWLKSYAQTDEDTIKSYSITISNEASDEGYLGLFAINGSRLIFFEDRLLANGKKFVIGVWLGTTAITIALILHIGRVSASTANALNKVLWDLAELVDKIIGLPQKFVGFIRKGPATEATPPKEPAGGVEAPKQQKNDQKRYSTLSIDELPNKKEESLKKGANTNDDVEKAMEVKANGSHRSSMMFESDEEQSKTESASDDNHDDDDKTGEKMTQDQLDEMETLSFTLDFRRRSSTMSEFDFKQMKLNETELNMISEDANEPACENANEDTNNGTDNIQEGNKDESSDKKQDKENETQQESTDVAIVVKGEPTATIPNEVIIKIDEPTNETTLKDDKDSLADDEKQGILLNGSAKDISFDAESRRSSKGNKSVDFSLPDEETELYIIENTEAMSEYSTSTARSTKSLVEYYKEYKPKYYTKLDHAFFHFAKSIQRFSTISTMIVIGFLLYDIYIYTRFARRLSYDWLLLFPFPFWMIVVTIINMMAFIITESILFCKIDRKRRTKCTIFYKIVSDFFISMSATTVPLFVLFHLFWVLLALTTFSIRLLSSATFYLPLVIFGLWLLAIVGSILKIWRNLIFLPGRRRKGDTRAKRFCRFVGRFLHPLLPLLFLPFWVLLLATLNFFSDFLLEVVNLEEQSFLVVFGIIVIITITARKIAKNCQPSYKEDEDEEWEKEFELNSNDA